MSGSIGKMGIADINGKMYLNQRIAKIVPKNNEISRVFLYIFDKTKSVRE
ncbi:MAG: hypothetical protein ACLSIL_08670 [Enterococcus casseliflavus]